MLKKISCLGFAVALTACGGDEVIVEGTNNAIPSTPVATNPIDSTPVATSPVNSTPVTSNPVDSTPVTSKPVDSTPVTPKPVDSTPVKPEPITPEPEPVTLYSGMFDKLEGVAYESGEQSGITNTQGRFIYEDGTPVTFSIGNIELGTTRGRNTLDIERLARSQKIETNLSRFLNAIDDDNNPANGIYITRTVRDIALGQSINFNQDPIDFENDLNVQDVILLLSGYTKAGERPIVSVKPVATDPVTVDPVTEPVTPKPVTPKPVAPKPVIDEPVIDQPTEDEPTTNEPVLDEPTIDEPAVDEPTIDEPVIETPTVEAPKPDRNGRVIVENAEQLRQALYEAKPGHKILLKPGTYQATDKLEVFFAGRDRGIFFGGHPSAKPISGKPNNPITIGSLNPNKRAILRGDSVTGSGYVLWIHGENWVIRDLILENGSKGLMLDNSSNSRVSNVAIRQVGDEALHLRSGTNNALIENVTIDGAGLAKPGFGEGIYVGSDRGQWEYYEAKNDNNVIRNCTIRNTAAETIDIKEGTFGTVVEGCSLYGGGISGRNYADSIIDIKGNGARIRSNRFFKENNAVVTKGVALIDRNDETVKTSSSYNWIHDNAFDMSDEIGIMVHAYRGVDNHAWGNKRSPEEGEQYKGKEPKLFLTDPR